MRIQQRMRRLIKPILIAIALIIVVVGIGLTMLIKEAYQVDLSKLEEPLPKPTVIIDKNGDAASELSSSRFTSVPLSRIPDELIHAIIAVEDQRFFDHWGVDVRGIIRSAWRNFRAGSVVQGGSTITQQLAKNLFFTSERTYTRKFNEIVTAYRIERKYSKEAILELYLNQIYFGEGTWGIQDAAKVYFGKDVQEIKLSEAALLAALPKAPTHYSPFQNEQKAKERRNLVLLLLYEQNYLTKEDYEKAVNEEIILRNFELDGLRGKYPGYVDYVIEEAIHKYGFNEEYLLTGGLHIFTQMDPVVQSAIEMTYTTNELFPNSTGDELVQSASVVIDPYTGGVRGLIGYRGSHVYRGFNRASQLKRQPGSAIKPLAVFAPALENGYKRNSMLIDEKSDFNGYSPKNFNDRYRGRVTLHEALVHSINVPAVALLHEMGVGVGVDFLQRSSIPLHRDDRNLSIALGGFTEGVSPLDMAQAFSMFPNLGSMKKAHAITRITSSTGEILLEVVQEDVQVMKPENAYTMTQILSDVVQEGTGKNAALNRPTAGKTGTTQLPSTAAFQGVSGVRDAWFVGYSPELVTAVWVGYDKVDPNYVMESSGGNHPAKIFQAIMSNALQNIPISSFQIPKNYREDEKKESKETAPTGKEKNQEKDKNKKPGKGNDKEKKPGKGKGRD
ncbi:transglycosylase domain-containing protein [Anaerobacillus isosaccharinicus]|uniref:Penicillin-binding protein n=1 Tax=Anaerobacillus isosaccharinicus TaxID=1532552 RepID=A0A1S2LI66_9BACI|nr:PBP1A family penicillin-binding protein [Anaerobacillus isosaccharinicus]MBA5586198.1 PBP1A family penicillin-binding protein [Anaerobacillus isosaccharinicus]QOY35541.1 PBP1A family penicillin-binding protein [Anaerobacillus isosaccharinicus]